MCGLWCEGCVSCCIDTLRSLDRAPAALSLSRRGGGGGGGMALARGAVVSGFLVLLAGRGSGGAPIGVFVRGCVVSGAAVGSPLRQFQYWCSAGGKFGP